MTAEDLKQDLPINTGVDWEKHLQMAARPTNYVFGAVQKTVINESGNWLDLDIIFNIQKTNRVDLMHCVSEGARKAIEAALLAKFGIKYHISTRFIAKMSNTTRAGNDMFSVGDAIRKYGFVLEEDWPYRVDMTWEEYYADIPSWVMKKAKENWKIFDITYEIIGTDNATLSEARKYGLPSVIGHAWIKGEDGMYYSYRLPPNHDFNNAFMNPDTSKPCFDSYPEDWQIDGDYPKSEFIKVLAPSYNIAYAMLYYVNLRDKNSISLYQKLQTKLKLMIKNIWMWFETVGSPKGMRGYYVPTDGSGKPKGKQAIDFENPTQAVKILFKAIYDSGMFKKTSWPEVKPLKDEKFI